MTLHEGILLVNLLGEPKVLQRRLSSDKFRQASLPKISGKKDCTGAEI